MSLSNGVERAAAKRESSRRANRFVVLALVVVVSMLILQGLLSQVYSWALYWYGVGFATHDMMVRAIGLEISTSLNSVPQMLTVIAALTAIPAIVIWACYLSVDILIGHGRWSALRAAALTPVPVALGFIHLMREIGDLKVGSYSRPVTVPGIAMIPQSPELLSLILGTGITVVAACALYSPRLSGIRQNAQPNRFASGVDS